MKYILSDAASMVTVSRHVRTESPFLLCHVRTRYFPNLIAGFTRGVEFSTGTYLDLLEDRSQWIQDGLFKVSFIFLDPPPR